MTSQLKLNLYSLDGLKRFLIAATRALMIPFSGDDYGFLNVFSSHPDSNRSTTPKTLLQMSPTLFSQACVARQENRIDIDVLHSGISYFLEPLLNWTLVGVVHAMLFEIQQRGCVLLASPT